MAGKTRAKNVRASGRQNGESKSKEGNRQKRSGCGLVPGPTAIAHTCGGVATPGGPNCAENEAAWFGAREGDGDGVLGCSSITLLNDGDCTDGVWGRRACTWLA